MNISFCACLFSKNNKEDKEYDKGKNWSDDQTVSTASGGRITTTVGRHRGLFRGFIYLRKRPFYTPQEKNLRVLDGPTSNKMETARLVTRFIKLQKACGWGGGETFQTALKSLNGLGLSHLASKHTSNKDSQFFVVCARRNINFFLSRMRRHSMLSFFLPFCIPKLPVVYVCPSRQRIQVRCERAASSR